VHTFNVYGNFHSPGSGSGSRYPDLTGKRILSATYDETIPFLPVHTKLFRE
jgi:hypothetical protein